VAKYGREHQLVGDVEIGIAGRQTPSTKIYRSWHWELHHAQRMARLVCALLQPAEVVAQRLVIGIGGVRLVRRYHRRRRDETGDIVNVPMGVVAGDAAVQPDHFLHPQIVGENLFHLLTRNSRIALLHVAQQALLGGDERPASIDVDASALQYHRTWMPVHFEFRLPRWRAQPIGDFAWEHRVKLPIVVLGPGVETPCGGRHSREVSGREGIAPQKDGAGVARPTAIGRNVVKANCPGRFAWRRGSLRENVGANQQLSNLGFRLHVLDQNVDALHPRQLPNDFRVHPRDGLEPSRPVRAVVRPRDPRRLVGFPLGWHTVAEGGRGLRKFPRLGHSHGYTRNLCVIGPYASTRRSRQKGQFRRTSSMRCRSTSAISTSSLSWEACATSCPKGSAMNDPPQNSRPLPGAMLPRTLPVSKPTRLGTAT